MKSRSLCLLLPLLLSVSAPIRAADPAPKPAEAAPAPGSKSFKNISPAEFEKLRADKRNVVLDVRTAKEFAAGHVPGAVNLDVNAPEFDLKAAKLDKSKTYLVHCAAGVRSVKACGKMAELEFPKLFNLEGGFKAWEKAGNKAEH